MCVKNLHFSNVMSYNGSTNVTNIPSRTCRLRSRARQHPPPPCAVTAVCCRPGHCTSNWSEIRVSAHARGVGAPGNMQVTDHPSAPSVRWYGGMMCEDGWGAPTEGSFGATERLELEVTHLLLAYRASTHETTVKTPASMVLGSELRLLCCLLFGAPQTSSSVRQTMWWT
jgi:hypothetical protein